MTLQHLLIEQDLRTIAAKLTAAADEINQGKRLDYRQFRSEIFAAAKAAYDLYDRLIQTPEHELQEP